jgi:predicted transcriptional regulator
MKRKVSQIIKNPGLGTFVAVEPDFSVSECLKLLSHRGVGCLLVIQNSKLMGVFTERDLLHLLARGKNFTSLLEPVEMVMCSKVYYVTPEHTLEECLYVMNQVRVRHLPVLTSLGDVVGLMSMRLITEVLISEKEFIIDQLLKYVSGSGSGPITCEPPEIQVWHGKNNSSMERVA